MVLDVTVMMVFSIIQSARDVMVSVQLLEFYNKMNILATLGIYLPLLMASQRYLK